MVSGLREARLRRVTGNARRVAGGIVGAHCLRPMRDRQQGRRDRAGDEQRDGDGREQRTGRAAWSAHHARRLPLTTRRESRAVAARAAVRCRDLGARYFPAPLVAVQRRDLFAHGLVTLEAVGRSRQGTAVRDAVVGPGGQIDEVLHHTDMTPRLILRAGEAAHADRLLVVLVRVGADLAAETLEANRLESGGGLHRAITNDEIRTTKEGLNDGARIATLTSSFGFGLFLSSLRVRPGWF